MHLPFSKPRTILVSCLICVLCITSTHATNLFSEESHWIHIPGLDYTDSAPVGYFRTDFFIDKPVTSAKINITAKGVYHLTVNGKAVSDAHFLPGWTDYNIRIYCQTFDIGSFLRSGENVLGVQLGDGWYSGYLGLGTSRQIYGTIPELLCELTITFEDGSKIRIPTNSDWKSSTGPILKADFYNGEEHDARLEMTGWNLQGFDDSSWMQPNTKPIEEDGPLLETLDYPFVRAAEILEPIEFWQTDAGTWVFDLGQNMVGKPRIKIPSIEGMRVTIRFAEMLEKDRTLYTENYRTAKSTDYYTCKGGEGFESWEPLFTFHGFRYVELSGLSEDVKPSEDWVKGVVLHNEMKQIGFFECSNPDLNQLQSNIIWGQKGNFLEVPTDCPQRDERLGWTGDAQVFAPTACFNFDVLKFFEKWMIDVRDSQLENGALPHVAPNVFERTWYDSPAWADACVIVPWEVYVRYGDQKILKDNFEMMLRWIDYQKTNSPKLIRGDRGFGDWLQPYQAEERDRRGDTDRSLIGTAYFAYSTQLTARIAGILGKKDKSKELEELGKQVAEAFQDQFWKGDRLTSHTQTSYLLALAFDLLPKENRHVALDRLIELIDEADGHLRTGFVGTPLLTQVLTRFGRIDLAYSILLKETYPGWIYSIRQGATTMWERWNSYSHEHGFGDAKMNSFNHYAYGAIGQWLYETVAGLRPDPDEPGYKHFFVAPQIGGDLTWAKASVETQFGVAGSSWRMEGNALTMVVTVPSGTTATIVFPEQFEKKVSYRKSTIDPIQQKTMHLKKGTHTFILN